jgi:hypothetical protein
MDYGDTKSIHSWSNIWSISSNPKEITATGMAIIVVFCLVEPGIKMERPFSTVIPEYGISV